MELKAILKQINPVIERGNFKSRKIWLTTEAEGKYPQTIEIELQQNKSELLNNVTIGSEITVHLNLRGREWTNPEGKTSVFNTLVCWKVDGVQQVIQVAPKAVTRAAPVVPEQDNDLPF